MHIAFVTPESPYGEAEVCGVAAYLRAIIPAIVDAGHRVTVIANANQQKTFDAEKGRVFVRHVRLPSLHWYSAKLPLVSSFAPLPTRQLEWSVAFYREAMRIAAKNKIDVIESTEVGSLFLNRVAPVVIRLHGSERTFREHSQMAQNLSVRCGDALEALACKRAAAVTAPSKFHAHQIAKQRGWSIERLCVIPNPISKSLMKAASESRRNGHTEPIVLYTGRLAPVKGIEILFQAARLVRATYPSIKFILAGPWQMPKPPEAYGLTLKGEAANGIDWVGPQSQNDLAKLYRWARLFVMPSYYESFAISVAEAMAFSVPVVASDAGALREIIEDGMTGLLVPPGDPEALAGSLIRLLNDVELENRIGRAGQDSLAKQLSIDRILSKTLAVYEAATLKGLKN